MGAVIAPMAAKHPPVDHSGAELLTLPLELRLKIYQFAYDGLILGLATLVVPGSDPHKWYWLSKSQLEFVSKQIRRECLPVRRQNTILHTWDAALLKTQPNQGPSATETGGKAAMAALPRSITSTLTHLCVHVIEILPGRGYNIVSLPKLRTITFDLMLDRIADVSDERIDKPKYLLDLALKHTRAFSVQQWPPEGLPGNGVKYYLRIRINTSNRLMVVSSPTSQLLKIDY